MAILADGQLAASAATILDGSKVAGSSHVSMTFANTSASATETVVVSVVTTNGTRRIARAVLAPNESLVISHFPIQPGYVLQGSTSDAATVDYIVASDTHGGRLSIVSLDASGNLKQTGSGLGSQSVTGDLTVSGNAIVQGGTVDLTTGTTDIKVPDNNATALRIRQGTNDYIIFCTTDSGELVKILKGLSYLDLDIVLGTTTGTKIGTAANQKLAFHNATPVVQHATTGDVTGFAAGVGTASKSDSVWAGASGATAYTVGDLVTCLKAKGLLTA